MLLTPRTRVWHLSQEDKVDNTKGLILLAEMFLKKEMIGAEIGCFAGVSTEVFATYTQQVYAIDPWETAWTSRGYTEISEPQMINARIAFESLASNYPNIVQHISTSANALPLFEDKSLDYVYIDGAHDLDNVVFDVISWKRKLKSHGLLMGHDCGAVLGVLSFLKLEVKQLFEDSSWVVELP